MNHNGPRGASSFSSPKYRPLDAYAWLFSPRCPLSGYARNVLAALVILADNTTGACGGVSLSWLESSTSFSRSTVQRAAAELIEAGLISRTVRRTPEREPLPSLYRIETETIARNAWRGYVPLEPTVAPDRADSSPHEKRSESAPESAPELSEMPPPEALPPKPEAHTQFDDPFTEAVLSALRTPALTPIATRALAARIASLARERGIAQALVAKGIAELDAHAGDAAAAGVPWPIEKLSRLVRGYVAGARIGPGIASAKPAVAKPKPKQPKMQEETPPPVRPPPLAAFFNAIENGQRRAA